MTWRKRLVRGLVFTALGGLLLAGGLFALDVGIGGVPEPRFAA